VSTILQMSDGDVERITARLFLSVGDRWRNISAFWVLLVLSAVIASAGVVADSTATVIGAMIVAPLMTPILGTALATVLGDRDQLVRSILLVLGASSVVVLTAYVVGLAVPLDVVAANNGQVSGRVSPRLIDLVAALATGLVGAFALIRSDVSDTLPGVAIAISLVPPLAVAGLTLESGAPHEAVGAVLLFGTNVAAIIATGTGLLLAGGLRRAVRDAGQPVPPLRGRSLAVVGAGLLAVAVPLGLGSVQIVREQLVVADAEPVASAWAAQRGAEVTDVLLRQETLHVVLLGPESSEADLVELRNSLDDAGLAAVAVEVTFVSGGSRLLTSSSSGDAPPSSARRG
jgi:uncharacterized hydrophobic protein (TIGR00271 family)